MDQDTKGYFLLYCSKYNPGRGLHTWILRTQEDDAGGLPWVWGQSGLYTGELKASVNYIMRACRKKKIAMPALQDKELTVRVWNSLMSRSPMTHWHRACEFYSSLPKMTKKTALMWKLQVKTSSTLGYIPELLRLAELIAVTQKQINISGRHSSQNCPTPKSELLKVGVRARVYKGWDFSEC